MPSDQFTAKRMTRRFAIRHGGFVRDVSQLIAGRGVAFVIALTAMPVISRLFSPSDFGVAALFGSLAMLLGALGTLSWERAAIVSSNDSEAAQLATLAATSSVALALVLWAALACSNTVDWDFPYRDQLGPWVWALPLGAILYGGGQVADGLLTRTREFGKIAHSEIAVSGTSAASRIVFGFAFGSSIWAGILGYIFGRLAKLAVLSRNVCIRRVVPESLRLDETLLLVAKKYRDFPLFSAPHGLVRSLSQELPIVAFGLMFLPVIVGQYAMANRVARVPMSIAAVAVQRVVLQRAAHFHKNGVPLISLLTKVTLGLAIVAAPVFALLSVVGERLISFLLGPAWTLAGSYFVILLPWLYALWVSNPAEAIITTLQRQSILLIIQTALIVLRIAVFAGGYAMGLTVENILWLFVAVSIAGSACVIVSGFTVARHQESRAAAT